MKNKLEYSKGRTWYLKRINKLLLPDGKQVILFRNRLMGLL